MAQRSLVNLTQTGILTALIFVFTAFIHIPGYTGYIHIGDAFIFLAASILPLPYAIFAGAFSAVLADCLTGFAVWAPASLIIKAVCVFFFTNKAGKILVKRNYIAAIPAAAVSIGGYFLYEALIFGNFITPAYGMIGNLTQAAASTIVFFILGMLLDKMKFKRRLAIKSTP